MKIKILQQYSIKTTKNSAIFEKNAHKKRKKIKQKQQLPLEGQKKSNKIALVNNKLQKKFTKQRKKISQ